MSSNYHAAQLKATFSYCGKERGKERVELDNAGRRTVREEKRNGS